MQIIDTFSGIGGFSLAGEWMGWKTVQFVEINPFCQRVLKYHWPGVPVANDIKTITADQIINNGLYDSDEDTIFTGGVPCQPWSTAGKRKGTEDDRDLWDETIALVGALKPKYAVLENVYGLVNWNGGMVFDQVQADLEDQGYEVTPVILPAVSVNAPHRRDRIWFVAYSGSERTGESSGRVDKSRQLFQEAERKEDKQFDKSIGAGRTTPNASRQGLSTSSCGELGSIHQAQRTFQRGEPGRTFTKGNGWQNFPTQSPVLSGNDGVSSRSHTETFYETNDMDRDYIIENAVKEGKIEVEFNSGKIYSRRIRGHEGKKKLLKGADCNGYIVHNLSFNGIKKSCRAHQIIWIAANGLYDRDKYVIDHKNRNKSDNRLDNLRLATPSQNTRNADDYTGQFSPEEKERIAALYHNSDMSMRELAEELNISKSRIGQIVQEQKLLDGITFPKWRNESIKAAGNAIVPQVAYQIFKAIENHERH